MKGDLQTSQISLYRTTLDHEYQQLNPSVGGPKNIDQLYDIKEIEQDFCYFDVLELSEEKTKLEEGEFHRGMASVIRFVGIKK